MTSLYDRWIARLRRNEDPQGTGKLGNAEIGYCCLGLLCVEAGLTASSRHLWPWEDFEDAYNPFATAPPKDVKKAAGLSKQDLDDCMVWNDTERLTFPEIADKLEERKQA